MSMPELVATDSSGAGALTWRRAFEGTKHLSRHPSFHAGEIGSRDPVGRQFDRRIHASGNQRFRHPWRADDVDAEASRQVDRGGANEAVQPRVHHADGGAALDRFLAEDAAGESEGALVGHERFADPY